MSRFRMNPRPLPLSATVGVLTALFAAPSYAATIFAEDFGTGVAANTAISTIGWVNDIIGTANTRLYAAGGGNNAVFSYANATASEAFYTTSAMSGGFTAFAIDSFTGLTFSVDISSGFGAATANARFIVQIDNGSWYASTTFLGNPTAAFTTKSLAFDPAAANWQNLTVSGTGANNSPAAIGSVAGTALSGTITGVGVLGVHAGNGTVNFDNYQIAGTAVPEPSSFAISGGLAAMGFVALRRRRAEK
jgi:hypothetical protein